MTSPPVHPFLMAILQGPGVEGCAPQSQDDQAWEKIVREADQQGLTSILYMWLNESHPNHRPSTALREQLKARAVRMAARNLLLAEELASVLRAFERAGIACAPIRGLALAELFYGDITARPTGDIDFLVRKKDLQMVADMLSELGFREMNHRPGFAQAYSYTLGFLKNRHGWIVAEPHWTIAYPPFADSVDMDAVWNRCVKRQVLGIESWSLGREDLLLHLGFHYLHHGGNAPLLWLYELDRLIRHDQTAPDWAQVTRLAAQMEQEMLLAEVLRRLTDTFETPVPDEVFSQLAMSATRVSNRSTTGALAGRLVRSLAGMSRSAAREELALFFALKGIRSKLRYLSALLFPSSEFMRLRYGLTARRQLPFSYVCRVGSVLREGCKGILCLFRHVSYPF